MYTVYHIPSKNYVGCTNNIERRMSSWYNSHNVPLSDVKILYQTEYIIVASMMEQQEQELLLGKADGYFYHKRHSEDHRLSVNKGLSEALSGEKHPMYGKFGQDHSRFGKTHSEESRAKMSAAQSGENHPMYGKTLSEETKAKISASVSAANSGESNPMYGKAHSEETRAKMSASLSGKVALNNGTTEVRVRPELVEDYLSQGFTYGRKQLLKSKLK